MKAFRLLFSATLLAASVAGNAIAQEAQHAVPMFAHPKPVYDNSKFAPAQTALQTWNGSFVYQGATNDFVMVGTDPSKTNVTTTFPVYIIPVKIGIKGSNGKVTYFDPMTKLSNGQTAVQNVVASPIFQDQDYTQGGTDLGNTQFEDAFQRGNFWTDVMTNTDYHTLLAKPIVLPEVTVVVPSADGKIGSQFGQTVAEVDYTWFSNEIANGLPKLKQIQPNNLPIIMAYGTYWTQFGGALCCIGGWHNAIGNANTPQTYSVFTYINAPVFSQDVSALSHELGEWYNDPYINNTQGACGGILEVGDPIENETGTHAFGDYPYTLNKFTYHLQDLVYLQYFGQTPSTSANRDWTFQGQTNLPGEGQIGVCSFGQ